MKTINRYFICLLSILALSTAAHATSDRDAAIRQYIDIYDLYGAFSNWPLDVRATWDTQMFDDGFYSSDTRPVRNALPMAQHMLDDAAILLSVQMATGYDGWEGMAREDMRVRSALYEVVSASSGRLGTHYWDIELEHPKSGDRVFVHIDAVSGDVLLEGRIEANNQNARRMSETEAESLLRVMQPLFEKHGIPVEAMPLMSIAQKPIRDSSGRTVFWAIEVIPPDALMDVLGFDFLFALYDASMNTLVHDALAENGVG